MRQKLRHIQRYFGGPERSELEKTHPALVPYEQLPEAVRKKDALFKAVVNALR